MTRRVASGPRALMSALLFVGLLPGLVSASATVNSQVLRIDLAGLPVSGPCWTEQLTIESGALLLVQTNVTDGSGNVHATFVVTYQGVRARSDSGIAYVVQSGTQQTYTVNYDSGLYEINLSTGTRWIAQGSAPDYWTSAWIHTTRTPSGDYAVDEFRFDAMCP